MINWNRENFLEYRKLKRLGYSHQDLKDHFGDVIYESGLYSKNNHIKNLLIKLNEIKINPIEIPYFIYKRKSLYVNGVYDYFAEFESNDVKYILVFMYFKINEYETYHISFTTKEQFEIYDDKLRKYLINDDIDDIKIEELKNIFEKETNFNDLFNVMKRLSFIILDMNMKHLNNSILSLADIDNYKKINLYRNIIRNSFTEIKEKIISYNDLNYYLFIF